MSKLYNAYLELKRNDFNTIYLFKSGIFYIALHEDAIILSNKFGFKLTNLTETVKKCGFPKNSLSKYVNLFKSNNIQFKIIDAQNNTSFLPNEYMTNNKITELIQSINNIQPDSLSVGEAYSFIEKIKQDSEFILKNNLL